ncbi:MAG: alpha/beta hydrolase [Anaerolineae bacterium]
MDKKLFLAAIVLALLLASCGQPAPSPTLKPTIAPTATATRPKPTATPTKAPPTPTATIEPTREPVARFEEAPCPFEVPEGAVVVCGFVVVPENHSDPDDPTIRLAVAVFKSQSAARLPDPVMLLCGGPGEKCAADAPPAAQALAPLYGDRDCIVFDQRGVGLSEPALECPEYVQTMLDLLDEPDPEVALQTRFDALMACRDRLVSEGHNLAAYNTVQNAADVNAIRIALGYDQVNLLSGSYGSLLAQATMRDHPEGIRSVVMYSVLPLEKSFFVDASMTLAKAIMRLLDACAADEACRSAYPDLQGVLFEVIDRLNAEPIPITITNPLDGQSYDALLNGDAVLTSLALALYQTPLIPVLPQAIYDVYNGDYRLMTQLTSLYLIYLDMVSRGMQLSVLCTEDLIGRTPEDLLNVMAAVPRQLRGQADPEDVIEYDVFGLCENWPVVEADPWVKEPLVSDIPTLVLAGEFDQVTPPEYGQLVASYLSNSYFFEFPGVGHGLNIYSECARSITAAFLDDPTRAPDAACIAEMPGVVFDLPIEAAEVVLEPFRSDELGISGVAPVGWAEVGPGVLARAASAIDQTILVQESAPGETSATLLAALQDTFGLEELPEDVGSHESAALAWDLYRFEIEVGGAGVALAVALAEDDAGGYLVMLMSKPAESDALYEAVFLSVVDALAPLE